VDAACGYRLLVNRAKALKRGGIIELEKGKDKKGVTFLDLYYTEGKKGRPIAARYHLAFD